MNKAIEGNQNEIQITCVLNKKDKYWVNLPYEKETTFAIHIIEKKFGAINGERISAKADIFFAKGHVNSNYLIENNYYLNEFHLELFNLEPIDYSGLSVKLNNSNYTIFKISPNTFFKLFNSNLLGAGASIYSSKEFEKNQNVLNGWHVNLNDFKFFFGNILNVNPMLINIYDKNILSRIKTVSNVELSKKITSDKFISDFIFKGIGNFEEPYTANWLLENDVIMENYYIPFSITTGSGRSKEIYTIVLKPKGK